MLDVPAAGHRDSTFAHRVAMPEMTFGGKFLLNLVTGESRALLFDAFWSEHPRVKLL